MSPVPGDVYQISIRLLLEYPLLPSYNTYFWLVYSPYLVLGSLYADDPLVNTLWPAYCKAYDPHTDWYISKHPSYGGSTGRVGAHTDKPLNVFPTNSITTDEITWGGVTPAPASAVYTFRTDPDNYQYAVLRYDSPSVSSVPADMTILHQPGVWIYNATKYDPPYSPYTASGSSLTDRTSTIPGWEWVWSFPADVTTPGVPYYHFRIRPTGVDAGTVRVDDTRLFRGPLPDFVPLAESLAAHTVPHLSTRLRLEPRVDGGGP